MRIVLDLQACQASSMHRGIGRYSMALALAMARNSAGHDLRIVLNEDYPDSVAAIRQAFAGLLPQSRITTFSTPVPVREIDPDSAWRLWAAERIRAHYLSLLKPDIVHVASLFEGLGDNSVVSVPQGEDGFATAVTLYDLIPLIRKERYLSDPNVAAWYYRKLDSLKNAGLLLAISASARDEAIGLLQLPPDRVVNISSAVDAMFQPRTLAPDARAALLARHGIRRDFIMYTGGIDYRKNIEGLIEAYALLPAAQRRQYQLAVVCSVPGPDRVRLQRLAARLGLASDDLVLTGFVPDDDLVSLYNCAALFVFPSLHEGFGLPALEAMACGAPTIGSNTSSIPEVIGRADALFDPTSVAAIRDAMGAVLDDPARRAELRAHGLAQARRFSWDASARRAIAAFEEHRGRPAAHGGTALRAPAGVPYKPRLAFVTDESDDTALLRELAHHYEIERVPAAQRTADGVDLHAQAFDRIVYWLGAAAAGVALGALLARHPGIVVLHDALLAQAMHPETPDQEGRRVYQAHGYAALMRAQACPCPPSWLERATGLVVHSEGAAALAQTWYGPGGADRWQLLQQHASAPADAARRLRDAIETLARNDLHGERALVATLGAAARAATEPDLLQVAASIAANRPRSGLRQVLLDVGSGGAEEDAPLLRALIAQAPPGWRIEPVRHDGKRYRYARRFTLGLIGLAGLRLEDAVAEAGSGDVLLAVGASDPVAVPPSWLARGVAAMRLAKDGLSTDSAGQRLAALLAGAKS